MRSTSMAYLHRIVGGWYAPAVVCRVPMKCPAPFDSVAACYVERLLIPLRGATPRLGGVKRCS